MPLIDFGNRYNENGKNLQIEYSKKMLNKSPGAIGLKNSKGAILVSLKPIVSPLHVLETDEKIVKITENCYVTATGVESDIQFVKIALKDYANYYRDLYKEEISGNTLKYVFNEYMQHCNSYMGSRVIGAEFIIMKKEENEYLLYHGENNGNILRHKGVVLGSIQRRARTELEKLDLESMNLEQLVEAAVKTFYACFDPLVDKEFKLEVGVIGKETNDRFMRLSAEDVQKYVDKYSDLTVDDS